MTTEYKAQMDDERSIGTGAKKHALLLLGGRLKRARERSGLTQADAAGQLEVTPQTVRNWERGRREPPNSAVKMMAELYEAPLDRILEGLDSAIIPVRPRRGSHQDRVVVEPEKMSEARRGAGLTQSKVSEITGLSLSAISRYESGGANPKTNTLEILAGVYGRPAEWFTPRGYFTDDERNRFSESVNPRPGKEPKDNIVLETYSRVQRELSEEAELRIAKFILFTHELELSGRNDDLPRAASYAKNRATARG